MIYVASVRWVFIPFRRLILITAMNAIMVFCFLGCSAKDDGSIPTSGQDTLSSDRRLSGSVYEIQGFDFSEGRIRYEYPSPGSSILDMSIEPLVSGEQAIGIMMTSLSQQPLFYDMGAQYLEEIMEAPAEGYIPEVFINLGHSYCIITAEGNFAKIYIVDMDYGQRSEGVFYGWIRFDWVYQSDGGRSFGDMGG